MPTFDTPGPISVIFEFDAGIARIVAGKRTDTVVEVLPGNSAKAEDVRVAQQTKVTFAGGKLLVKAPRKRSVFGKSGAVELTVELPAGSDVQGFAPMADLICEGVLGDCRLKTSLGDIQVAQVATADLRTSHGDIRVARVAGDADIVGAGRIEIGEITGTASVKNGNGDTEIGEITGDLVTRSANGAISVGVAHGGVEAKSANGTIRIGEVARGKVTLQGASGDLEIGIRHSTAAWLDVSTGVGTVRNSLGPADGPGDGEETVEVHARTSVGDIVIHRS
ncbi:DUF4097 family beta strand repeat-containing protein [Streptomyces sp. NPDC020667]|uniref:DUF4097 family beta strand repeat-containing protein n=1 Tax=Streptomyces sp. NPDC020667 TaxID=3154895 RepID=UPI0033C4C4AE